MWCNFRRNTEMERASIVKGCVAQYANMSVKCSKLSIMYVTTHFAHYITEYGTLIWRKAARVTHSQYQ